MQNCLRVIYAWKSILKARKVITLGSKWRVRDGSLVRIYEDNWIPGNHEGRIISAKLNLPHNATVSHLMDMNSGWWNFMLIDNNFLPFEAQKMKAIPLSSFNQPNHLFWPRSSNGMYSVKTSYQLLCEEATKGDVAGSSIERVNNF
uniref:Uncharacterized protein n=1 Tax=Quercus lobata TaxID=97700 RepID=A0A7N2KN68_QUELO